MTLDEDIQRVEAELKWRKDLVRLAHAYREAEERPECDFGTVERAANALLRHAYNGGKAP